MKTQLRISAKNLGALALPNFCQRCTWLQFRLANRLPFQIFPGIFSSIDSYTKRVVHGWFDEHGGPPPWFAPLGPIAGYIDPPHFSKFNHVVPQYNILLTGGPDGVLRRPDGSYVIVDYKTAKYTGTQDELFPMYETQLNAYAFIGQQKNVTPVTGLALIYMEPVTHEAAAVDATNRRQEGFAMGFSAHIEDVTLNMAMLDPLFQMARNVFDSPAPPIGRPGCEDCTKVNSLVALLP